MTRKILVADLFCGAGGSSTGAARALARLGLEMELVCVNHWGTALETHQRNHPRARHYCADISQVRPHQVVPEGYLDLLMASPTCTHHSIARGGKPTSDQQRSDPWHVITWLTELRVKRMLIENVWGVHQMGAG
ncbi:site-specific DNA-cytosine methylase [Bradyrhizobium diazoefficiens]